MALLIGPKFKKEFYYFKDALLDFNDKFGHIKCANNYPSKWGYDYIHSIIRIEDKDSLIVVNVSNLWSRDVKEAKLVFSTENGFKLIENSGVYEVTNEWLEKLFLETISNIAEYDVPVHFVEFECCGYLRDCERVDLSNGEIGVILK